MTGIVMAVLLIITVIFSTDMTAQASSIGRVTGVKAVCTSGNYHGALSTASEETDIKHSTLHKGKGCSMNRPGLLTEKYSFYELRRLI